MKILALLSASQEIWFHQMKLYLPNGKIIEFPADSSLQKRLCKIRFFVRLLRLEPRCATFLSDDILIVAFLHKLWFISLSESKIIKTENLRFGWTNILTFCSLRPFGKNIVYYGDYGGNSKKDEVHVYKIDEHLQSKICYTFPSGTIRHIHNILYDEYRERFFIFTGDIGDNVGIYIANNTFTEVVPYQVGQQSYRAVIGKVLKTGLLYATDAVMEDNYLFYISFSDNILRKIVSLDGSVIYGIALNNGLVFSTTVEPRPSVHSKIITYTDNRRGKGIKTNFVDILYVSDNLICNKLKSYKKDFLPMKLFQYGAVMFPTLFDEKMEVELLPVSPISVKRFDGKIDYIKIQ